LNHAVFSILVCFWPCVLTSTLSFSAAQTKQQNGGVTHTHTHTHIHTHTHSKWQGCIWPTLCSLRSRLFVTLLAVNWFTSACGGPDNAYRFLLLALCSAGRETFLENSRHHYGSVMPSARHRVCWVSYRRVWERCSLSVTSMPMEIYTPCLREKVSSSYTRDHYTNYNGSPSGG